MFLVGVDVLCIVTTERPVITAPMQDLNALVGSHVEFRCPTIGTPSPWLDWYHNAQPIRMADGGDKNVLISSQCLLYYYLSNRCPNNYEII